ncbi:MAG: shikimate dehydrogenase [Phycisphaerae bacterium]|nr:shikimate dehydrogenase [Phycisphaerae bacterium]
MTLLIAPITASTAEQLTADLERACQLGADIVELRLDYMPDLNPAALAAVGNTLPLLITPRRKEEGGASDATDAERCDRLVEFAPQAALCDTELATWETAAAVRHRIAEARAAVRGMDGQKLILSAHDFEKRPADFWRIVGRMNEIDACDVAKIVFQARHISETFEVFDLMHENAKPVIAIAMGEAGLITRILAKKFGAFATFASLEAGKESAPGQITLDAMKLLYRWDAMRPDTTVYGVIGNPVGHSMSPAIHNAAFSECDINGAYVPLLIEPTYEHFEDFLREALARPWFDLRGCSVTIPHKDNALRFTCECGGYVEPLAGRIGAVNTLTFEDGRILAHNTDYAGAMDALTDTLGCQRGDLHGNEVAVLGAGGAARGVVAGLRDSGCKVTIYNRTPERATRLAEEFGCTAAPLAERVRPGTQIVVNTTSLGMHPNVDDTPLPADRLQTDMTVFDTVYNPIETRLLREARALGCRTVDGVAMFVHQAAAQFERWTGQSAPHALMRQVVLARLTGADPSAQR